LNDLEIDANPVVPSIKTLSVDSVELAHAE
jgi:hypothetical protein